MLALVSTALGCGPPREPRTGHRGPVYPYGVLERSGWSYGLPYRYRDGYFQRDYYESGYRKRHDPCVRTKRGAPIIRELKWYHQKTERVC